MEYRVVSLVHKGYFVLYASLESARDRARNCALIGSRDVMAGPTKVQSRKVGISGDDSTWKDLE